MKPLERRAIPLLPPFLFCLYFAWKIIFPCQLIRYAILAMAKYHSSDIACRNSIKF